MDDLYSYIENPSPVWDWRSTNMLTSIYWKAIEFSNNIDHASYETSYFWNSSLSKAKRIQRIENFEGETIFLEVPNDDFIESFYSESGLVPLSIDSIENEIIDKIQSALRLLDCNQELKKSIFALVKRIQIVSTPDPEIDVGHSDPEIPFTIFISICENNSKISNLRVLESIIHEAMHLKLTLLEKVLPLIEVGTTETFYSPWRDEARPIKGVLHGVYVFKSVYDFMTQYHLRKNTSESELKYIIVRKNSIENELKKTNEVQNCIGFTRSGAILLKNLLPLS
jgi:hypothetical protein